MAKKAAAIGVPKSAAKAAAMPLIKMIFLSFTLKWKISPSFLPMLPPICSAAPSRPTEPPHRIVIMVELKISSAIRNGIVISL